VNKHFIESFKKEDEGYLVLQDKTVIPISRLKREFVKKELHL
jgi:two-component system LytT family response regulator